MATMKEELLTQDEVAKELKVKYGTVKLWTNSGKLPSVRLAWNVVRVRRSDLNKFIEENARYQYEKEEGEK